MDPPTAGAQSLGAAEQPRGLQLPSGREAPPSPGVSAARGLGASTTCGRGREVAGARGVWATEPGKRSRPASGSPAVWARARAGNSRAAKLWGGATSRTWVGAPGWEWWLLAPGHLCVLAKWEVMLLTESWGCCWGAWAGAR
ncbi:hypothetical protein E5288_WYG020780 [Bos mutus]|uniref:Uncharacterized protein n=1 Tax=Bos mutus TaxID=72004 RepID=A0A6B0R310_9CETA|nr:hypothetical protein [Bos mutus]